MMGTMTYYQEADLLKVRALGPRARSGRSQPAETPPCIFADALFRDAASAPSRLLR